MPKIICNDPPVLTGQVGSVQFVKGAGETDNETMLAYFAENPDRFEFVPDDEPDETEADEAAAKAAAVEAERLEAEQAEADRIEAERIAAEDAEAKRLAELPPAPEPDGFDALTVEALRKASKDAGLPVAGSKAELTARLRAHATSNQE